MGIFPEIDDNSIYLSRKDPEELLGSWSRYSFELEGHEWPSVEHYYQAMKFDNEPYREKIRQARSPAVARKMGRTRLKRIRRDWGKVKEVVMTRGVYISVRAATQSLLKSYSIPVIKRWLKIASTIISGDAAEIGAGTIPTVKC